MTPQLREALIAVDALLRRGEARAAAAMLERIALESPDAAQSAELQLLLGQASFQDGEWAAAERAVGKAIELRPALAEAHRLMGLVLAELDRLDEAASRFEHALLLHPRHGRTCANLGLVERRMGRLPEAQSHFREAVEIDRTYAPAWRGLAETLQAAGGDEEAIAAWRSWWALQTDRAEANTTLGAAFARMHRWHDAETALSLAVQSKVADAGAAMQLGFVRRERGDIDGAIAAYELAAGQSKALAPRIAKALVLPQVYRDGADLRTWRQRYEDGVTELEQSSATMGARDNEARLREIIYQHALRVAVSERKGALTTLIVDDVTFLRSEDRRVITQRKRAYFELVRAGVTQLKKEGRLRQGLDATVATFTILGMVMWLTKWYEPSGRLSAEKVAGQIADMALATLVTDGA